MKVEKNLLEADSAAAQVADAIGADEVVKVDSDLDKEDLGEIYRVLDASLKTAKGKQILAQKTNSFPKDFPNVLFIGGAGIGKTAQIESWAKDRGVKLFTLQGSSLDAADMGGLPTIQDIDGKVRAQKVGTGILDQLDRPNSVLFLDELNRARQDVRAALLQLINEHKVQDFTADDGMRRFPNFLFTIAASNPAGKAGYQTYELDQAEKGRFRNVNVKADNAQTLKYLYNHYKDEAALFGDEYPDLAAESLGRAELAKTIIGNASFVFDDENDIEEYEDNEDWNGLATTPRNITLLLDNSDGTKASVLKMWHQYCNSMQEPTIKRILSNYKDVDNKANSVFKQGTQSSLLNKKSGLDALRNKYGN